MRKKIWSKSFIIAALAITTTMSAASVANATTTYPEGGTWEYGVYEPAGVTYVYSNYYHPKNWHRSSVIRGINDSTVYRSGDAKAGVWAKIEKTVAGFSGRKSYYYKYNY